MGPAVARAESAEVFRIVGDTSPSSAESSFRELDDVFLQTQARIWLGEVLHTRLDEQLNISDLLDDGELLFEVSKVIWKMLLTECTELIQIKTYKNKSIAFKKSSGRYMPYSNVDSFLKICKILGLTGIDLFSPSDVDEKRDIRKVCMCIRSLSKKARSKHLNVPDFDIVTYTVAMPTNMVGCIRRSLELSQCSSSSSASYSPYSRAKCRQKNSVAACARNYDSYSDESDDTESNHTVLQSHSPSTSYSYDAGFLMTSDLQNSPGVSSMVKNYTLGQSVLQSDIQDQDKDEYAQGQCELLRQSVGSLCSQHVMNDHQPDSMSSPSCVDCQIKLIDRASHINNGLRHGHVNGAVDLFRVDLDLGNGPSVVGDSVDGNTSESSIAHQLSISDLLSNGTYNSDPVLFDEEDSISNVHMGTDSHRSNSTQRTANNGFGRRFSDDVEDGEVSSTASMSSVSGRVLNLDFENRFAEDDFKTIRIHFPELQSRMAEVMNENSFRGYESQDMVKYETLVHSLTPDIENPESDMKLEDIDFSNNLFLPCQDHQLYTTGYTDHVSYNNGICTSQINSDVVNDEGKLFSIHTGCLNKKGALKNVDWDRVEGFLSGQSHSLFDFHKKDEKCKCSVAVESNENGHGSPSPKFVLPEGLHEELLHHLPTKASGDALWLKDINSIVADNDKELFSDSVVDSDSDTEKHPNNSLQAAIFNNISEITYEDSNASFNTEAVEETAKCHKLSSTDDGIGFQHQDIIIRDMSGQGRDIVDMAAVDNPAVRHNLVVPANPCEPTREKHPCLTIESSENVGKKGHLACTDKNKDLLHCADEVNSQDKSKHEKMDMLAVEVLDEREDMSVEIPRCKPHRRPLLKSVAGGTALLGVLFLFLHLRKRSGGEKTGEASAHSSQIQKANGVVFSSQKGQKDGRANGVYPAEKLKFGN